MGKCLDSAGLQYLSLVVLLLWQLEIPHVTRIVSAAEALPKPQCNEGTVWNQPTSFLSAQLPAHSTRAGSGGETPDYLELSGPHGI